MLDKITRTYVTRNKTVERRLSKTIGARGVWIVDFSDNKTLLEKRSISFLREVGF